MLFVEFLFENEKIRKNEELEMMKRAAQGDKLKISMNLLIGEGCFTVCTPRLHPGRGQQRVQLQVPHGGGVAPGQVGP